VICIGDVHGCVEEVCDLLRKAEFLPGDQVVFLGKLLWSRFFSSILWLSHCLPSLDEALPASVSSPHLIDRICMRTAD
jgi:hypothetical protein